MWDADHGDWALSFYMSFSGHLYNLISWQDDFNSRTWPKCCGKGRVSLWAELLYWGGGGGRCGPPTPFIERRFGSAPLGLLSGHMYMSFSAPSVAPQLLTKAGLGKG